MSNDLHFAIVAATHAASADKTLPILNSVLVTPAHVWATDRYVLVRSNHNAPEAVTPDAAEADSGAWGSEGGGVLIPVDVAKKVKVTTPIEALAPGKITFEDGSTLVWPTDAYDREVRGYPNLQRLIPDAPTFPYGGEKASETILLNPSFLAKIAKMAVPRTRQEKGEPVRIRGSRDGLPHGPLRIDFQEHTTFLVVPLR